MVMMVVFVVRRCSKLLRGGCGCSDGNCGRERRLCSYRRLASQLEAGWWIEERQMARADATRDELCWTKARIICDARTDARRS